MYFEFLARFASRSYFDTGLTCSGVACWLSTAHDFEKQHEVYGGQKDWPADWLVIALDYEGCFLLDVSGAPPDDAPVYFLDHNAGYNAQRVADSFVAFLERIAKETPTEPPPGEASAFLPQRVQPEEPMPPLTRKDKVLGCALILGVIAFSTALVLGVMWLITKLLTAFFSR